MALFRGVRFPGIGRAGGYTIYYDFGPFDIGLRWWDGVGGGQLEFGGEDGTNMWCS